MNDLRMPVADPELAILIPVVAAFLTPELLVARIEAGKCQTISQRLTSYYSRH